MPEQLECPYCHYPKKPLESECKVCHWDSYLGGWVG